MSSNKNDRLMTMTEAAEFANVSRQSIHNWIKNGNLNASMLGSAGYQIKESDLLSYLKTRDGKGNMTTTKEGLSLSRHIEIGNQLKEAHSLLTNLSTEFANAYRKSGKQGRVWKELSKTTSVLQDARAYAESNLIDDFPEDWNTKPSIY